MSLIIRKFLYFSLLIITSSVVNAEIYKWTDEHGRTHYGDRPNHSNAEQIDYKSKPSSGESEERSWEDIQAKQQKFLEYLEYERRIRDEKEQERQEELAEVRERCAEVQAYRTELDEFPVFYREDDEGNREFLSAEEKDDEIKKTEDFINRNC